MLVKIGDVPVQVEKCAVIKGGPDLGKCASDQRASADESCLWRGMCKHQCCSTATWLARSFLEFSETFQNSCVKCELYCQTLVRLFARLSRVRPYFEQRLLHHDNARIQ